MKAADRIEEYRVPVDGEWHTIQCADPIHVATRDNVMISFWTGTGWTTAVREFAAVQADRYVEPDPSAAPDFEYQYRGTAISHDGSLVWHLIERVQK